MMIDLSGRAGAGGDASSLRAPALIALVATVCAYAACGDGGAQGPADATTSDGLSTDAPASGKDAADHAAPDAADAGAVADGRGGSLDVTIDGASAPCRAATDCAAGSVCVGYFCAGTTSCTPRPRRCEPDPCRGALACGCAGPLCDGYASCDVDPDAGAVFCSTIASMDDAGPL